MRPFNILYLSIHILLWIVCHIIKVRIMLWCPICDGQCGELEKHISQKGQGGKNCHTHEHKQWPTSNRPTGLVLASATSFQFPLIRARIASQSQWQRIFESYCLPSSFSSHPITENMVSNHPFLLLHLEIKNGSSININFSSSTIFNFCRQPRPIFR